MRKLLHFEDVETGQRFISPSRTITEEDIHQFAHLTWDFNPLHLDKEFARQSPFGRPIAHGLLGLSFGIGLATESPLIETVAFLGVHDWQFVKPVYVGDSVYVVTEVSKMTNAGRKRGRVLWKKTLLNQNDEVVQVGSVETLVTRRNGAQTSPVVAELGVESVIS